MIGRNEVPVVAEKRDRLKRGGINDRKMNRLEKRGIGDMFCVKSINQLFIKSSIINHPMKNTMPTVQGKSLSDHLGDCFQEQRGEIVANNRKQESVCFLF